MKSKLIFILLTLATTIQLVGQEVKDSLPPKFLWGITVAPGLSKINTKFTEQPDETVYDYKSSFQFSSAIGLFVQKKLKNNFLLESGLLYSSIQGKQSYCSEKSFDNPYEYTYKFWYFSSIYSYKLTTIQLPILIGYKYKKASFLVGIQSGYNTGFSVTADKNIACTGDRKQLCQDFSGGPYYRSINKIDMGIVGKFKYKVVEKWEIGFKFCYGIIQYEDYDILLNYYNTNLLFIYTINTKNK